MGVPPTVDALLFCDQALIEEGTRKSSVIGIFERIRTSKFPHLQNCFLFCQLSGGKGEAQCFIRITEIRTGEIRFNLPIQIDFKQPEGVMRFGIGTVLGISGPGWCHAEFICEGEVLKRVKLQVEDVSGSLDLKAREGTATGIPDGLPPEAATDPDWWKNSSKKG